MLATETHRFLASETMSYDTDLTTAAIAAAFADEVGAMGGTVTETFDDGQRLFARSILPKTCEVLPRDRVRGGVALRATVQEIVVHPYVFRKVCSNGAIFARALASQQIDDIELLGREYALSAVRAAVQACSDEETFAAAAQAIRSATDSQADLALNLMPMLARLSGADAARSASAILRRFFRDGDSTRFGLMNAVTSVARDIRDPEARWELEKVGGAIAAEVLPAPLVNGGHARRAGRLVGSHK
jgi:hypothetical protein